MNNVPFVSLVVPLRNDEKYIGLCLESLARQTYPKNRIEILVVDGQSEDGSTDIVKQFAQTNGNIRLLPNARKISPVARNIGVKHAKGEYIGMVDSHCSVSTNYVDGAVSLLQGSDDFDCVGGIMLTQSKGYLGGAISQVLSSSFGVGGSRFRTSAKEQLVDTAAFALYRRAVFEKVGLFDERLERDADNDFHWRLRRLGGKILLTPKFHSHYFPPDSVNKLCRQAFRNGLWNIRMTFMKRRGLAFRHFVPLGFVSAILIGATLSMVGEARPLIFLLSFYAAGAVGFAVAGARKSDWRPAPILPILFFLLHMSYGLGSIYGIVEGTIRAVTPIKSYGHD